MILKMDKLSFEIKFRIQLKASRGLTIVESFETIPNRIVQSYAQGVNLAGLKAFIRRVVVFLCTILRAGIAKGSS